MQKKQQYGTQRLKDVRGFLTDRKAVFPGITDTSAYRTVDTSIGDLESHDAVPGESIRTAQSAMISARSIADALVRDLLSPMVRIARAELPNTPEVAPLRVLADKRSVLRLASAARGMAKAAVPFKDVFVKAGMSQDFLDRIEGAAAAIGDAVTTRNARQVRGSGATKGVEATLRAAGRAVHVLDGLVRSTLRGNAELLGEWERAKRLRVPTATPVPSPVGATHAAATPAPVATPAAAVTPAAT